MTTTLSNTNPTTLSEPTPGSPEALVLLANAGVLPAGAGTEDPRFAADAVTTCISRLLEVNQQQELLASEQKELNEQLRLAHLRGDLLTLLPAGKDGNGYQSPPTWCSTGAPAASSGATRSNAKRSNASSRRARATNSRAASPATASGLRSGRCGLGRADAPQHGSRDQEPWVMARGFLL